MTHHDQTRPSLLDRVGGTQGIEQVAQLLYAAVVTDDLLSEFFDGCNVRNLERRQIRFLITLLAKDAEPNSQDHQKIAAAHSPLVERGLGNPHFDRLLQLMDNSLHEVGIDQATRTEVQQHLNNQRGVVLGTASKPTQEQHMTFRFAGFIYAILCYIAGMASLVYIGGWLVDFGMPTALDAPASSSFAMALLINLGLVTMFGIQHSVMARPWFKTAWTKLIPEPLERATYVLFSAIALLGLMWFWQPMGVVIWHLTGNGAILMYAMYALGWIILVSATFYLNHFELFGLRQAWLNLRGLEYTPIAFATPGMYRWVRHPIYVGWFILIWAAPVMTISHLAFALLITVYTFLAIPLEEKDLDQALPEYAAYKEKVPALIPRWGDRA